MEMVMKKLGVIWIFLFLQITVFGEEVPKRMAQDVGLRFLSALDTQEQRTIKEVHQEFKEEVVTHYIINYEPEGWAVIAADDRVRPILAYSLTGSFDVTEEVGSPEARYWMNNYKEQVLSVVKENKLPKNKDWGKWLDENEVSVKSAATSVAPLLTVKWNQNSGWNRFCPADEEGPGGHAYVGCVAVAMAQAMSAQKYPARAQGSHSYVHDKYGTIYLNYNNEQPYDWNNMPANSSNDENARLLYHCAVAVSMDFGASGSGSYSSRVAGALKKYFGYTDDVKYFKRSDNDAEWKAFLKAELDKGNVLIYSGDPGTGDPGHSFNIDGYDMNGYFHFNWGWSGKYDAYYTIDNINPGTDKFNQNQDVVVGISDPYFGPTDITLSNLNVYENLPAGSFVATVEVEDNSPNDIFTFELDGGPKFPRGTLEAAFYIENDTLKTKYVFDSSVKNEYILNIKVTDQDMNAYKEEFLIEILPQSVSTSIDYQVERKLPAIYYSYADNAIVITSENGSHFKSVVDLFDIRGVKIYSGLMDKERFQIKTGGFKDGLYIIRIFDPKGINQPIVEKLIIGNNL